MYGDAACVRTTHTVVEMRDGAMTEHDEEQAPGTPYARRVGERLRAIRRQKRLSLQEVEARSTQEFKASVLGAYERGERAISVPRLQRLAKFYNVPVDQLLPHDEGPDFPGGADAAAESRKVAIDLAKLEEMPGKQFEMLGRFLRMIQLQRQDFNGRVLTIRSNDLPAIAVMLEVGADDVVRVIDDLGLRFVRPPAS
jgi:transcriptional regulator with XRE-family HTH domain